MQNPPTLALRHTLAALAYRSGKALRGTSNDFATFQAGKNVRTPGQVLAHMGDLLDWCHRHWHGDRRWVDSEPLPWQEEIERFFTALEKFDRTVAASEPQTEIPRLFQGPIADAFTHVGHLTQLRRLAGEPIRGESYYFADVQEGRLGLEQTPPKHEFD